MVLAAWGMYMAIRLYGFHGMLGVGAVTALVFSLMVHPLIPFSLYFAALFFAETGIPGLGVSANQVLAILFFLSFLSYWARGNTLALQSRMLPFLGVLAVYFSVSALTGENFERGVLHFRYVLIYFVMAVFLAYIMRTENAVHGVAWIVTLLTFAAAVAGLVEALQKDIMGAFTGKWTNALRVKGFARNSIVFGWNMLFAFPFAFFLFSEARSRLARFIALGCGLFILFVAVLTFNRQTFIGIAVLVAGSAIFYAYENRKLFLSVVAVGGIIGAFTIFPMVFARLFTVKGIGRDVSFLERRDQFLLGVEMWKANPIFGVGLGSYPAVWKQYVPADYSTYFVQYDEASRLRYPDFGYLALLAETGVVGLVLFVALLGVVLRRAWALRREAEQGNDAFAFNFCSMIIMLSIFLALTSAIQDTFLYVRVWIMLGLALLLDRRILFAVEKMQGRS